MTEEDDGVFQSDDTVIQRRRDGTLRGDAEFMPTPMGEFRLEFLEINPAELETELYQHTAEIGWLGTLADAIKTKLESKKLDIDGAEADLQTTGAESYLRVVEEDSGLAARDPARRTVDAVKMTVASDQHVVNAKAEILALRRELLELDHGYRQVHRIVSALHEKGKMLQSAIGLKRSQMEMQLQDMRAEVSARSRKGEG